MHSSLLKCYTIAGQVKSFGRQRDFICAYPVLEVLCFLFFQIHCTMRGVKRGGVVDRRDKRGGQPAHTGSWRLRDRRSVRFVASDAGTSCGGAGGGVLTADGAEIQSRPGDEQPGTASPRGPGRLERTHRAAALSRAGLMWRS